MDDCSEWLAEFMRHRTCDNLQGNALPLALLAPRFG
jgi:hypothetical protein